MEYGKNFGFALKAAVVVAVVGAVATAGYDIKETKATLAAPTGKCGASLAANFSGMNTRVANWTEVTVSSIATVDFDAGTINFVDSVVTNFGKANAATTSQTGQVNFTIVQGSFAGQYVMTIANGDNSKINVLSTNSGNTFLLQSVPNANDNGPVTTGVCQAL